MDELRVLYLGGTGTISWSCVRRSLARGRKVAVLNRGRTAGTRPLPAEVELLVADVGDPAGVAVALGGREFDAVVNFLTFTPEQARTAVELFAGRTGHYLHISTAALYQKPPGRVPYLESTPRHSPGSRYASQKIAAEDVLLAAYGERGFPVTIVRPSHTYDDAHPPLPGDWTALERLLRGEELVVPGDGTSLWTLTHAEDFAVGLDGLFANPQAHGEAFHLTSEFVCSWNQIYGLLAAAGGVEPRLLHVPTDLIALAAPDWFWSELIQGDLQYSVLLDNAKIRAFVPGYGPAISFAEGARRLLAWRRDNGGRIATDSTVDAVLDRLVAGYHQAEAAFRALAP